MKRTIFLLTFTLATIFSTFAQAEKSDIRKGNEFFKQGKYPQAETAYKQAIGKNVGTYEGAFNLGGSLYKQQRWEEAATGYAKLASEKGNSARQSEAFYNLGNSNVKMRKLQEAIDSYKDALRLNPSDAQAKFNLAYAQKLKAEEDKKNEQDKDENKDNQDNQDQNKDNKDDKQDPDKKDDKKDQDKKDDKQDPDKDKKDQEKEQPQKQQPNRESQQMLNAIQAAEDKTKEKLDKQKEAEAVGMHGVKQW